MFERAFISGSFFGLSTFSLFPFLLFCCVRLLILVADLMHWIPINQRTGRIPIRLIGSLLVKGLIGSIGQGTDRESELGTNGLYLYNRPHEIYFPIIFLDAFVPACNSNPRQYIADTYKKLICQELCTCHIQTSIFNIKNSPLVTLRLQRVIAHVRRLPPPSPGRPPFLPTSTTITSSMMLLLVQKKKKDRKYSFPCAV